MIIDLGSLSELEPVFKHLNSVFDRSYVLETVSDDRVVDDLDGLNVILEELTVVVMPAGDLDVKNVVLELLDVIQVLVEHDFEPI